MNKTQHLLYSIKNLSIVDILRQHASIYKNMQPTDAVKLIYQSTFGPGHMIADEKTALVRTIDEISTLKNEQKSCNCDSILYEEIGGGYARLYLTPNSEHHAELITKLFVASANLAENNDNKRRVFLSSLELLRNLTNEGIFSFTTAELDTYLTEYASKNYPAVSHSEEYRAIYHPAYRVVKREFAIFFEILAELSKISQNKNHAVLAIDGYCASGKSTLADIFSNALNARLIHMDDFFLPPEKRTQQRLNEAGGNVDYERFKSEVIDHLSDESLTYGIFDCSQLSITSKQTHAKTPITIIEGSYSHHPYFGNYADMSLFLEVTSDEQLERIKLRDGEEMLENFKNRWIPMEKKYAQTYKIAESSDYLITVTAK